MPGCMIVSENNSLTEAFSLKAIRSINNAQYLIEKKSQTENFLSAISYVSSCVISESRFFNDENFSAWFSGTLPGIKFVPWQEIISALENKNYDIFNTFSGSYAIAVHNYKSGESFLISDRCSQYPVFYSLLDNKVIFSTSFKTFFSCLETKIFDEKWLTDFLIFNFPLSKTTPIKNVYRMPAASILTVSHDKQMRITEYASIFQANIPSCSEKEMEEKTHEIFSEQIPLYYQTVAPEKYATAITSGFDARTTIAYIPENVPTVLYTYGIEGCPDIETGRHIAQKLGLDHHYLCIDNDILDRLSEYVLENIDYASGANPAMRGVLLFAYDRLAKSGSEAAITGISADHFFRSMAVTPHTLSDPIISLVKDPHYDSKSHPYFSTLSNSQKATEHLDESRQFLEDCYNWSNIPISERLLTFNHYELATKHFGGELSLAENFVSMASPYWDSKIRELSYNTNLSTLTITCLLYNDFPYWKQHQLFSSLLVRHPKLKDIPIDSIPPSWYAKGNKFTFDLAKIIYKGPKKLYRKFFSIKEIPLEAWNDWLGAYVITKLIDTSKELLLAQYIDENILKEVLQSEINPKTRGHKTHLAGKIVTAELLLRKFQ